MIQSLIAHLEANTSGFKSIRHAFTEDPVEEVATESPALIIRPGDEKAKEQLYTCAATQQTIVQVWMLVISTEAARTNLRNEIFPQAMGWTFEKYSSLQYVEGSAIKITGEYIWWLDVFQSEVLRP